MHFLLVPAIALGVACYFVIPKTDLEYEYLFVNGELDIDMIMSKSKRKRVKSLQLAEADLVAPSEIPQNGLLQRKSEDERP